MLVSEAGIEDLKLEARVVTGMRSLSRPAVAFSGGVDSSYLLALALEVHGPTGVTAFFGTSPSVSENQRSQARDVARFLGVDLSVVATSEFDRPEYRANEGNRCYFCKDTLFRTIRERHGTGEILDGTNADDLLGHRPGHVAIQELGVRSPLAECGLGKVQIRRLSHRRGLATASLPASPCLASRFPAGTPVSLEGLRRVEAAESMLQDLGYAEVRVRHHGELARIELPSEQLADFVASGNAMRVENHLRSLGYRFITLDLAGFRSGSSSLVGNGFSV